MHFENQMRFKKKNSPLLSKTAQNENVKLEMKTRF